MYGYEDIAELSIQVLNKLNSNGIKCTALHDAGCKTWVSIEPYPAPNIIDQDINEILTSIGFVDKIIFGRLNYNPAVSAYKNHRSSFNNLARIVMDFCKNRKIQYHIKKSTLTEENCCEKQRLSV